MKKILLILVSLSLMLLSSCDKQNETDPENMNKADNDLADYYFYYPKDWQLDRNDKMISIKRNTAMSANREQYSTISVMGSNLKNQQLGVNQYWEENEPELKNFYKDTYKFIGSSEIELNDVPASIKEYSGALGDVVYRFAQVICIRKGYVYFITFTAIEDDYDKSVGGFETVISNFHFK